jgi:hypothetical protein
MEWGIFILCAAAAIPALFDKEYRKGFIKGVALAALACFILAVVFI